MWLNLQSSQNHTQSAQLDLLAMSSVKYLEFMLADDTLSHSHLCENFFFLLVVWRHSSFYPLNLAQYSFFMAQPIFSVREYTWNNFKWTPKICWMPLILEYPNIFDSNSMEFWSKSYLWSFFSTFSLNKFADDFQSVKFL